jgi:hypothetical protein
MLRRIRCALFPLFCPHSIAVRFDADNRIHSAPQCRECGRVGRFQPHQRVAKGHEGAAATALIERLTAGEEP